MAQKYTNSPDWWLGAYVSFFFRTQGMICTSVCRLPKYLYLLGKM